MSHSTWVRLDNASNIFLAARSEADPKVFRIAAELDSDVDPVLLQRALDATYAHYRLYHAVLRGGVFWYYLQESQLRPQVAPEHQHTCAPIYRPDRRNLLFRVLHHRRRVILEIFHALSDGTGALWFLTDLLSAYTAPESNEGQLADPAAELPLAAVDIDIDQHVAGAARQASQELRSDSFAHYFRRPRYRNEDGSRPSQLDATPRSQQPRLDRSRVYRVRGTRTPDSRPRLVELTMPADQVLQLAKAERVSMTMYLTALFFVAVRSVAGDLTRARTFAASIPINLRQFFPSTSARNFFAAVRVAHTFDDSQVDIGVIARDLEAQFRPKSTPEALERKLRRLIRFERSPFLRVVPRVAKDVILRVVNWGNNRGLTVAVSNLGRVALPTPAAQRVGRLLFHVSAVRPQFCAISHAGLLTISFTSPYVEVDHVQAFARQLTGSGVDVSVAMAQVTEAELAASNTLGIAR